MEEISQDDVKVLIEYFSKNIYRAKYADKVCNDVMQKCLDLATLDYSYVIVPNKNGELSAHYPSKLIIFEAEQPSGGGNNGKAITGDISYAHPSTSTIYESVHEVEKLKELFGKARSARCRARFPVPVILFRGKNICRSSTLSGGPEIYGRSGFGYFFSSDEANANPTDSDDNPSKCHNWVLFDQVRNQDIKLLKVLGVQTIVDFMVEKKKVKFGMNVTSSEKVDKRDRYNDFKILSLPYPGCEFFKQFRDNNYSAKNLIFNWDQSHVDADMIIPEDNITLQLKINWKDYKHWDLVTLTENYLLLLLHYLTEGSSGLLVHCISGWDRTPLFISLLRICLWADGAIHQSLSPIQLLYFTIAYDWMLFGHNLEDRKTKGEDIFYFCFYILKHLTRDEFSINRCKGKSASPNTTSTDTILEGDYDGSEIFVNPQGSNVSLHSSWSSISSKSQENPVFAQAEDPSGVLGSTWYLPMPSHEQGPQGTDSPANSTANNATHIPVTCSSTSVVSRSTWYLPQSAQEQGPLCSDPSANNTAVNITYIPSTSTVSSLSSYSSLSSSHVLLLL
uniref:Myotubularin phosphatase domain-containing protein n=1 Tax=Clastoptera arizonana TaxID=38151 RepID=A0A1B6DI88_9HEMI